MLKIILLKIKKIPLQLIIKHSTQNVNNLFQILLSRYFYINLSQYLLKINYQYSFYQKMSK
jgi:hypothetical protein